MAYQIDRYNNTTLTTVEDGTIDQTTDLKFIGKNYAGYGEIQNENMLFLLENFSGTTAPQRPLSGQLWYDSSNTKLKFYDGNTWKASGGATVAADQPTGFTSGDFWWDSANDQLYVYNGTIFVLIGPQNAGEGLTQMQSLNILGVDDVNYSVIAATIEDNIVYIISDNEFQINPTNSIVGFDVIRKGLTLKWTLQADNGITNSQAVADRNYEYHGTASNSKRLGGKTADEFLLKSGASFTGVTRFPSDGITLGPSNEFEFKVENQDGIIQQNLPGQNIIFRVTTSLGALTEIGRINQTGLIPGANDQFDIGSSTLKWNEVYATNFRGTSDKADQLKYATGQYAPGSQTLSNNTVAVRTADGNLVANLFQGTATSARYADLAEKYTTDQEHPVGTVMAVGGEAETRPAKVSDLVVGVVSDKPAYLMNADADGQALALKGRVPVRVSGPVSKGQAVYAWQDGIASTIASNGLVGVALETNNDEGEKLVECVLKV